MASRHKYEYQIDVESESAAAKVVRLVGHGKRVLEIGAGPGSITRVIHSRGQLQLDAVEFDSSAIEVLKNFCNSAYQLDLNDSNWPTLITPADKKYDVIVAADVLEHLLAPIQALKAMKSLLNDQGYAVVSLPHIGHNGIIASLSLGSFQYRDWGLLDRTHLRFFGISDIQRLFDEAGFSIMEAQFVIVPPVRTEFSDLWRQVPYGLKRQLKKNRYGNIYQVVIKARPGPADEGVSLEAIPIPKPTLIPRNGDLKKKLIGFLKSILLPHLSLASREKIQKVLVRLGINL